MTPRQADCLAAIKRLTVEGVPPTLDMLAADLGISGKGGVHRLLSSLREQGRVDWEPHRYRSLRVIEPTLELDRRSTAELLKLQDAITAILVNRHQGRAA